MVCLIVWLNLMQPTITLKRCWVNVSIYTRHSNARSASQKKIGTYDDEPIDLCRVNVSPPSAALAKY